MSDLDWSDLDARLLRLLVTIVEAGSITGAAQRLGVTQSAVSHLVNKLRAIVGDALFVKSGRGIIATARAEALAAKARDLLRELEHFAASGEFDPARWRRTFTIAANDFQRDALLPALLDRLRARAPGLTLTLLAAGGGHHAKASVRRPLPGVLRPSAAARAADQGRISGGRSRHGRL